MILRLFMEDRIRYDFRYGLISGGVRARNEQAVAPGDDGGGDACNLGGRLPLPEHHFRKALAGRAMMVDLRKAQVFHRRGQLGRAAFGVSRCRSGPA